QVSDQQVSDQTRPPLSVGEGPQYCWTKRLSFIASTATHKGLFANVFVLVIWHLPKSASASFLAFCPVLDSAFLALACRLRSSLRYALSCLSGCLSAHTISTTPGTLG